MAYQTLISVAALATHLQDPHWVLLDCRASLADSQEGARQYQAGHLPGARFADLLEHLSGPIVPGRTGRHPLPEREQLAASLRAWGINTDTQVVAYDGGPGAFAARCWWLLRWLGHTQVAVLDGGLLAWQAAGLPLTQELPAPKPGSFQPGAPLTRQLDASALLAQLPSLDLLDARSLPRYLGQQEPLDPVAGHIPGARCLPWEENLNDQGKFLPPAALAQRFAPPAAGQMQVCYCGSGVTATHNILAMVHAGLPEPSLYPGSWSEWITDPSRPLAP